MKSSPSRPPTRPSRPMMPAAATPSRPTPRASTAERLRARRPDDHIVLPEIISKEPLGPAVRHGDDQWGDIVALGALSPCSTPRSSASPRPMSTQMKNSDNPEIKRLLGTEGKFGEAHRPDQRLGRAHHQARRQLRRDLRAQCRRGLAAEDQARPERAVDQGRPAIRHRRSADPQPRGARTSGRPCRSRPRDARRR